MKQGSFTIRSVTWLCWKVFIVYIWKLIEWKCDLYTPRMRISCWNSSFSYFYLQYLSFSHWSWWWKLHGCIVLWVYQIICCRFWGHSSRRGSHSCWNNSQKLSHQYSLANIDIYTLCQNSTLFVIKCFFQDLDIYSLYKSMLLLLVGRRLDVAIIQRWTTSSNKKLGTSLVLKISSLENY